MGIMAWLQTRTRFPDSEVPSAMLRQLDKGLLMSDSALSKTCFVEEQISGQLATRRRSERSCFLPPSFGYHTHTSTTKRLLSWGCMKRHKPVVVKILSHRNTRQMKTIVLCWGLRRLSINKGFFSQCNLSKVQE